MTTRKPTKTNTNALTQSTLDLLTLTGCTCWRSNQIPVPTGTFKNGKMQFRRFTGMKGVPDIVGFYPIYLITSPEIRLTLPVPAALFIGVEIKTGADKISPAQAEFGKKLMDSGGWFFVVHNDTKELERFLREEGLLK